MSTAFGFLLLILGVVILILGGRKVTVSEGSLLRLLFPHDRNVKYVQWVSALICFYLGFGFLLGWFQ